MGRSELSVRCQELRAVDADPEQTFADAPNWPMKEGGWVAEPQREIDRASSFHIASPDHSGEKLENFYLGSPRTYYIQEFVEPQGNIVR